MLKFQNEINKKYRNGDPLFANEILTSGLDIPRFNLTFNNTIIDLPKNLNLDYININYDSINNNLSNNQLKINISNEIVNFPYPTYLTSDKLFKSFKKTNNLEQNQILKISNELTFYFRHKLNNIFDKLNFSYNLEYNNINFLSQLIPYNYDLEKNTYKAILELKNEAGIFKTIQFGSYPFYPELDYESGIIKFFQKNIEKTNNLEIKKNEEFYISFIRYEGNFGAITSEISDNNIDNDQSIINLKNWQDASLNNLDISNLITIYNNLNFGDLSDNNIPTKSQIKEFAENNFFFF